jgi:hypothetical protein
MVHSISLGGDVLILSARVASWLGESFILLPLAVGLLLALWRQLPERFIARWSAALLLCVLFVSLLKVAGYGLASRLRLAGTPDVSGHEALSVVFYGGLAWAASAAWPARKRMGLLLAAAMLVLAIGVSRLLLRQHSVPEVLAGILLGGLALAATKHCSASAARPLVVALILVTALLLLALPFGIEPELTFKAVGATLAGRVRP